MSQRNVAVSTSSPTLFSFGLGALLFGLSALTVGASVGCESVNHESIEKWQRTEKGPAKLLDVLRSDKSAELRAHAAQVLIRLQKVDAVTTALGSANDSDRERIVTALIPRLVKDSEVIGKMTMPTAEQSQAKDALFEIRSLASDSSRAEIDGYLVRWLTGGFYEGRAKVGRNSGKKLIRTIGLRAGPSLVELAQVVLASPENADGKFPRIGDELLDALAFCGHPDALNLLLNLAEKKQRDPSLSKRAMNALYQAVLKPVGIEPLPGQRLTPVVKRLEAMAKNESLGARLANDAVDLLAAVGMPDCLEPFVSIVSYPHSSEAFRYIGTQRGIRCGGVDAIVPITEAMPTAVPYPRDILNKYLWREVAALPARKLVAERARLLLDSDSWVARVTGIELLGMLKLKEFASEDAKKIAKLAKDRTTLRKWYGADSKRADPTLGQLALRTASELAKL